MKKNKIGFSLIELLLTLSIIITLITAAFFIYQKVKMNYDVQAEVDGVVSISSEIKSAYKSSKTYYGLDNYFLYDMKAFPSHFSVNKSKFNTLNGTYSILGAGFLVSYNNVHLTESSSVQHGGDLSAFSLQYMNLDKKYCMPFLTKVYSYANTIQVGNTMVKSDAVFEGENSRIKTFDRPLVQKLCSNKDTSNMIILTFF